MRSGEFKTLLTIQAATLIIVVILLFNSLARPGSSAAVAQGFAISSPMAGGGEGDARVDVQAANNFVYGDSAAANFLIVFSRYNCSYCRYFYASVFDSLQQDYILKGKLKVICKDLVGPEDTLGMLMAKVAEVARQTGHFPAMHRLLVMGNEPADSLAVTRLGIEAGIPAAELAQRLNSKQTLDKIHNDYTEAKQLNITATPSYVLNGTVYIGYMSLSDIVSKIETTTATVKACDVK